MVGARHFDHFDFLVALSDELGRIGVEHHRSCETGTSPTYFTAWESNAPNRDVMSHEYTHSWNGKHRRGEDSWTPSFERPIRNSLMWVYEGQTQYWGNVLSARSGLWTVQQTLAALARTAAIYDNRAGSTLAPAMSDTTRDLDHCQAVTPSLPAGVSWQRSEDYYAEGQLVWLDVDTRIRELSGDTRSLDDFARAFFGAHDGNYGTHTYDFEEVVRTLGEVAPFDWAAFLVDKLESHDPRAPLEGLTRGGGTPLGAYRNTPKRLRRQDGQPARRRQPDVFHRRHSDPRRQGAGSGLGESGVRGGADRQVRAPRRQRARLRRRTPRETDGHHGSRRGAIRRSICWSRAASTIEPSRSTTAMGSAIRTSRPSRERAGAWTRFSRRADRVLAAP